ncbi:MAG TPA: ABC transporter ATP-binding protein [Ktedonobacterales bacterium]
MTNIQFVDVTKTYPGAAAPAVDDVSFSVREGAICMLLGTSGSGKTTLLRMVNRLIDPTSGKILVNGVPTTDQDPIALRRGMGYVIQQVGLFPHMTVTQNVATVLTILGERKRESTPRVDELLHLVGLDPTEYAQRYPRQLSGGQQQRVGLARALAADPSVLLMDEPFGALDAITRARVQDELLQVQRGVRKTILFVTHDVNEAFKLGDQIIVMSDGKLQQQGTPVELLARPANDFVRQLVGADDALRQLEYLPVTTALEPLNGTTPTSGERIPAAAPLLDALLRLIAGGEPALAVERDGATIGQVTLGSLSAMVLAHRAAPGPNASDTSDAGAGTAAVAG